jgi:uncharacterized membrane protein
MTKPASEPSALSKAFDPFRRALIRGLGVLLPPLLTIVIFLWVGSTVRSYLLEPIESRARQLLTNHFNDEIVAVKDVLPEDIRDGTAAALTRPFQKMTDDLLVPSSYYDFVADKVGHTMPTSAEGLIEAYVNYRFLSPYLVIPVFTCVFLLVVYLLGKFLAAGVGRFFWTQFERLIDRLPLIRNVYSSVKQVTDFVFSEQELRYTRVVAIEYPRKGIWATAFVTGEGISDIRSAANEPILSLLVPTSPMPFTGFTVNVKRSETIDLNITMDQALQFIISCGVVCPPQQLDPTFSPQPLAQPQRDLEKGSF